MKCAFCGAELRPGAKFCTQCGMSVNAAPDSAALPSEPDGTAGYTTFYSDGTVDQPAKQPGTPAADPMKDSSALDGYTFYTSGSYTPPKKQPDARADDPLRNSSAVDGYTSYTSGSYTAPSRPAGAVPAQERASDMDWAAGAALACAVLSLASFYLVIPGIVFAAGAIIFGIIGLGSELRSLAIGAIIAGAVGALLSIVMIPILAGVLKNFGGFISRIMEEFPFEKFPIF